MTILQLKYSRKLQDCEDTLEAYSVLCKMVNDDKYYAEAYRNLLYLIHRHFFTFGLKNPCFVLDTILREYVMTFDDYKDKKNDLFSCSCNSDYFDDVINQYIDYEEVLIDDEYMERLIPSFPLSEQLLFDYSLFEDDFICMQRYERSTIEMEDLFKYAVGDKDGKHL